MDNKYTFFWRSDSPFSNWYPSQFKHDGIMYNCGEQYMMYQKAMLFGDFDTAKKILKETNPRFQKSLGREVKNYRDSLWAEKRVQIMVEGLYEKFSQNERLKSELLLTGDTEIVEASPSDKIWGIGLSEEDPDSQYKSRWKGLNLLGITLMQVRNKIKEKEGEV